MKILERFAHDLIQTSAFKVIVKCFFAAKNKRELKRILIDYPASLFMLLSSKFDEGSCSKSSAKEVEGVIHVR